MTFLLGPMRRTVPTLSLTARTFSTSRPSQLARMTIVGRIGTDPEVVETKNGNSLVKYVVGSNYGPKDNRQTSWFRVTSFAPAESASREYVLGLQKGTLIFLEGDARMNVYEDSNGKKQSSLDLVQTKVEVLKRPVSQTDESADGALGV